MTLYEIIDILKKISLTQPNIRTATDGDVYEKMNGNPSVRYGVFHVTQTTHTEDEQFDSYGFNLFMIDRLEDDDSNRVSAQSTAKQQLSNIINTFCETFDAERNEIVYQPFTQRFKDNTCGVWASVTMQVVKDYSCAESYGEGAWYPEIVVINNEDITITENGVYEPSEGYTGFGKVEVALDIPNVKESDTLYLTAGDNGVYKPQSPYDAVGEVIYHVEPNQNKTIDIVENGEYVVMPDEGFGGIGAVEVNVELPIQEKAEVFNDNGEYTILPDEGYVAMRRINVKVDYKPKPVIPNGITLSGSTFSTIDMSNWDWSRVYDWSYMFQNCSNLETIENFPSDVEVLGARNMFISCGKLTAAPMMNTSNVTNMSNMFYRCESLTTIPPLDTSNVTNMYNMFAYCDILTTVPPLDTSNVTDMGQMFYECGNLETVLLSDTSNVTSMYSMFGYCQSLKTVPTLDTSNVTTMQYMFNNCKSLQEVRFTGNPINLTNVSGMCKYMPTTGTLYYPAEYASAYQKIINVFPTNWVKVAE